MNNILSQKLQSSYLLVQLQLTKFIELNRLYTMQLTVVILQLVTSATCFRHHQAYKV